MANPSPIATTCLDRQMMKPQTLSACFVLLATTASITAKPTADEGWRIDLRHTEGRNVIDYQYLSTPVITRIDRLGEPTRPPSPWNLIDRESGAITIVRPHNQTITKLETDAFEQTAVLESGIPELPPDIDLPSDIGPPPSIGARPSAPGLPSAHDLPTMPTLPGHTDLPSMPPTGPPSIPESPHPGGHGIRHGIPGPPTGIGGIPTTIPPVADLVIHEETREIHGHACTLHTMDFGYSGTLELWLAKSPDLPPFYLLLRDGPQPFGHPEAVQHWPHVVRKTGKFPLLAILREVRLPRPDGGCAEEDGDIPPPEIPEPREISRWEITSVEPATPEESLFVLPEHFSTLEP